MVRNLRIRRTQTEGKQNKQNILGKNKRRISFILVNNIFEENLRSFFNQMEKKL